MIRRLGHFFRKEAVLCISAVCAALSMLLVPPSQVYASYIDYRVLGLLFSLMAVVAGLQRSGLFVFLAQKLLNGKKQLRVLSLLLVLLPFFSSMLITNDVALITFVPFALLTLRLIGQEQYTIWILVLQTAAANLGSMMTPVGNPQNLFLYAKFQLSPENFFSTMLPLTLASLFVLSIAALSVRNVILQVELPKGEIPLAPQKLIVFGALFLLCLLSVFRVLPYEILLGIIVLGLLVFDRKIFCLVDYSLLLTFVCFFVFAGNLGQYPPVRGFLERLMQNSPLFTSIAASQVISNVPAAVLLSGFSTDWKSLLLGTNIGGLGTLIASLASLISFRFYMKTPGAKPLRYLGVFTLVNGIGLAVLISVCFPG